MPAARRFVMGTALALATPVAAPVAAQQAAPLPAGARVRAFLRNPPTDQVVGVVVRTDSVLLVVRPDHGSAPITLGWDAVRRLDVSRGRRSRAGAFGHGAAIGAIVGGTIALAATGAAAIYDSRSHCDCIIPASLVVGVAGAGFTVLTTATGGAIGLAHRDRWARSSAPSGGR